MATAPLFFTLNDPNASVRLRAALLAGTDPDAASVDALVERCAVEPDFFVRDMLAWALTRHPADVVVPRLMDELASTNPQARSQALHTLSKIRDPRAWPVVSGAVIHDPDDEVARSAWRAAVALAPDGGQSALAADLVRELGRGDSDTQRSLSRSLVALGDAILPLLAEAVSSGSVDARAHGSATERLLQNPDSDFATALEAAKRAAILERGPIPGTAC
jgi:HEAT repeat protein